MMLFRFPVSSLLLTSALALAAANPAIAQTDADQPADTDAAAASATAPAPDMAEIEKAWASGDFVTVREGLAQIAEAGGSAQALYLYGRVLAEGRGGPRDVQGAQEWLARAVEGGSSEAAVLLARIYLSAKSDEAAKAAGGLLQQAAASGNAEGQYYLGLLQRSGRGIARDPAGSFKSFLASARQGYVESQYELARAYSRGEGVPQSNAEAQKWLTEAAGNGHVRAQYFLASALDAGQGVAQDRKAALGWYLRAAEAGHPAAQRDLGMHYLQGTGTEPNPAEGLRWLGAAAQAGDPGAQLNLGTVFAEGEKFGVEQNDAEAVKWYHRASEQTFPQGMVAYAEMMLAGRGTEQDSEAAVALLRRALRDTGYAGAALRLGQLAGQGTLEGLVAPQNAVPWAVLAAEQGDEAALAWLEAQAEGENRPARTGLALYLQGQEENDPERIAALLAQAAEEGDVLAQFKLGELYSSGTGVPRDFIEAHKWFNIAAAQGAAQAAEQRAAVAKLLSPEEIASAQDAASAWFAAEAGRVPQTKQRELETGTPGGARSGD